MTTDVIGAEPEELDDFSKIDARAEGILLCSILIVAMCGIVYELIIAAVSSYLLGNSIYQFSITVGFFMFAMGIGSYLSQFIRQDLIKNFVRVEVALAIIGGLCSITLFMTFPFSPWIYRTVMIIFITAIGTLVGLEIPLLTRILAQGSGTRKSIAKVLSLDYVGALIGSVAFPLFLLPSLGLVRASFGIGLINIMVALVTVFFLRDHFKGFGRMTAIIAGVFVALFALIIFGSRISAFAQHKLYFDQVIWEKDTQYQRLVVTNEWGRRDLRLFIDGHLQFSELDEHRYHEMLVHSTLSHAGGRENILVLGGGDGLAAREILKYPDVKRIDLVDLDPEMTKLGLDFAPLRRLNEDAMHDPKVHVYNMDAFVFVKTAEHKYDRVIIDMPDPHNEALSKLYSVEFYSMIDRVMKDDGILISQSSSPYFANKAFWCVGETLGAVFPEVVPLQASIPSFGVWGFQLASKTKRDLTETQPSDLDLRFWSNDVHKVSTVFPVDVALGNTKVPVNSIFEPRIYHLYLNDLQRVHTKREKS